MTKKKKRYVHFVSIDEVVSLRQARNINKIQDERSTFADKLADKMADFAGSWSFILVFAAVIVMWIIINTIAIINKSFDPYPFILLNLILSCVAAMQAPVIMMSQNRQEEKDRIRNEHDYAVNLKAEILIEEILMRLEELEKSQKKILNYIKEEVIKEETITETINSIEEKK